MRVNGPFPSAADIALVHIENKFSLVVREIIHSECRKYIAYMGVGWGHFETDCRVPSLFLLARLTNLPIAFSLHK